MVGHLLEDIPTIRIGITAHGDYCDEGTYVTLHHNFGHSKHSIETFVNEVQRTSGGDFEECYELVLQEVQTKYSWSKGFSKALVMIGDAIPHDKNPTDIFWREEAQALADMGVKIYAVQCGKNNNQPANKFWKELAELGQGSHLNLKDFNQLREVFMGLCYREATEVQYQQQAEVIEGLTLEEEEAQLLLPEEITSEERITDDEILSIHNAIHDHSKTQVVVGGESNDISVGNAGCRYVRVGGLTFIEQNKEKDTKYARMAIEGKSLTWICKQGRWGLIIDKDIVRK